MKDRQNLSLIFDIATKKMKTQKIQNENCKYGENQPKRTNHDNTHLKAGSLFFEKEKKKSYSSSENRYHKRAPVHRPKKWRP